MENIVVEEDGVTKCVVYTRNEKRQITGTKIAGCNDVNVAKVLTNNLAPVTADTDLVVIAQPDADFSSEILHDKNKGFFTTHTENVISKINKFWQENSENKNSLLQHGDEAFFGLNPINDTYKCYDGTNEKSETFDLRSCDGSADVATCEQIRKESLIKYASWLAKIQREKKVVFPIPTADLMKTRDEYLNRTFKFKIGEDKKLLDDYKIISEIINKETKQPATSVPLKCKLDEKLKNFLTQKQLNKMVSKSLISGDSLYRALNVKLYKSDKELSEEDCEALQEIRNAVVQMKGKLNEDENVTRILATTAKFGHEIPEQIDLTKSLTMCTSASGKGSDDDYYCPICSKTIPCLSNKEQSLVRKNLAQIYSCLSFGARGNADDIEKLLDDNTYKPCMR
ncbi:MAG: hypothetical protein HQK51_17300 [Oligoflexia bacterium]|nr:hypothetical protein [Oligoflexia bacterium]